MAFILLALIGFGIGYWLSMSRAGYITWAATAIVAGAGQIAVRFAAEDPEKMTMLPLVVGLILVLFMVLGAATRARKGRSQRSP